MRAWQGWEEGRMGLARHKETVWGREGGGRWEGQWRRRRPGQSLAREWERWGQGAERRPGPEARCLAASSSWAQVAGEEEQEDRLCREEEGSRPHTCYTHYSLDTVHCAHLLC